MALPVANARWDGLSREAASDREVASSFFQAWFRMWVLASSTPTLPRVGTRCGRRREKGPRTPKRGPFHIKQSLDGLG
jgi:hypothetical protein